MDVNEKLQYIKTENDEDNPSQRYEQHLPTLAGNVKIKEEPVDIETEELQHHFYLGHHGNFYAEQRCFKSKDNEEFQSEEKSQIWTPYQQDIKQEPDEVEEDKEHEYTYPWLGEMALGYADNEVKCEKEYQGSNSSIDGSTEKLDCLPKYSNIKQENIEPVDNQENSVTSMIDEKLHEHNMGNDKEERLSDSQSCDDKVVEKHLQTRDEQKVLKLNHYDEYDHKSVDSKRGFIKISEGNYDCLKCFKHFSTLSSCKKHMVIHSARTSFTCTICVKNFMSQSSLRKHTQIIHNGEKPFKCHHCDKGFTAASVMVTHMLTHKDKGPFKPEHFYMHNTREETFKCYDCDKHFHSASNLKRHLKVHTKPDSFKCQECDKCYASISSLNKHIRIIHNGEKPFKCHSCDKSFTSSSVLVTHIGTHSGEQPFKP